MSEAGASTISIERPFPGLRPFGFADHEFFFGREDQSYALYRLLDRSGFIAVVGSSGSGKSSLVLAGLRPLLEEESADQGGRTWRWVDLHPGDAPLRRLADALLSLADTGEDPLGRAVHAALRERIVFALQRSSFGLNDALQEIEGLAGKTLVLVVDQFEEVFRYASAATSQIGDQREEARRQEEVAHFVQLLLEFSRGGARGARVIITMRSDFIGDCARFHGLPEAVSATQFLVPSLTRDQREEAIRRPIEAVGATIEPVLVERLMNDSSDELDPLPVLQHCMLRLWEHAGHARSAAPGDAARGRHLDLDDYQAIGGIAGALSRHADEVLANLAGCELVVEQVFRALSEVDKTGRATRRALRFNRLVAETGAPEEQVRRVVDRFRGDDCSFLVPSRSAVPELASDTRIDVGHEALLRRWERISGEAGPAALDDPSRGGWLKVEEYSGRLYRALLALVETAGTGGRVTLPLDQVEERWAWWNRRPRTDAWAERYGGGFGRVQRLFADSLAALEADKARRVADEAEKRLRVEHEQQAARERQEAAIRLARVSRNAAIGVSVLFVAASVLAVMSFVERRAAESNFRAAEHNFNVALESTSDLVRRVGRDHQSGAISAGGAKSLLNIAAGTLGELAKIKSTTDITGNQVRLLLTMSDAYLPVGEKDLALHRAEQAKELALRLAASQSSGSAGYGLVYESMFRIGDVLADQSKLDDSQAEYGRALEIAQRFASLEPASKDWQVRLAFIHNKMGDALRLRGRLDEAVQHYRDALQVAQTLAAKEPANPERTRDVAATMSRIGDVMVEKGDDLPGALREFQATLAIKKELADKRPGDASYLSNLSVGHNRVANVLSKQGDQSGALVEYESSLAIREQLADSDPGNADWQSQLAFQYVYIGDAMKAKNDPASAVDSYKKAMAVRQALVKRDPGNLGWQRNLANGHIKLADAMHDQGHFDDALAECRAALDIHVQLVAAHPGDAARARDLLASHERVGNALNGLARWTDALVDYKKALVIADDFAGKDPDTTSWQASRSSLLVKTGDMLKNAGDARGAVAQYRLALAATQRLAETSKKTALQRELAIGHAGIGDVLDGLGDRDGAVTEYRAARDIWAALAAADPGNAEWGHALQEAELKIRGVTANR
jgi:tetratricopeptide (TPR) repeat protein